MSQFGFIQADSRGDVHMNRSSLVRPSTWQDLREGQRVAFLQVGKSAGDGHASYERYHFARHGWKVWVNFGMRPGNPPFRPGA